VRAARRGEGSKKGLPDADIVVTTMAFRGRRARRARSQMTDGMRRRFCSQLLC